MKLRVPLTSTVFASLTAIGITSPGRVAALENLEPKIVAAADTPAEQQPAGKVPSSNPLSGNAEAIELGTKLYFTWCVQCHGQKANGESRFGKYAGDLTKFWRGYKEFVIIVKNGRVDKMM